VPYRLGAILGAPIGCNTSSVPDWVTVVTERVFYCNNIPAGPITQGYAPYVKLWDGFSGLYVLSPNGFAYRRVIQLLPSWVTAAGAAIAVPSSAGAVFPLEPALAIRIVDDFGLVPDVSVSCVLNLDAAATAAAAASGGDASINTMLVGTTTAVAVVKGSVMTATFAPGVVGSANASYYLQASCSIGGQGPWYSPASTLRVRLSPLTLQWVAQPPSGALPTAAGKGGASLPANKVTPLTPPPSVRVARVLDDGTLSGHHHAARLHRAAAMRRHQPEQHVRGGPDIGDRQRQQLPRRGSRLASWARWAAASACAPRATG
jgi:hypothetical protein